MKRGPLLSVIVVFHDMRREAARTLLSLSREYQIAGRSLDYEVIAVDNGSRMPLDDRLVRRFGSAFRYLYHPTESRSPCAAINVAAGHARGRYLTVCIDGARILSPGVLHYTTLATRLAARPVITTLAWHLGRQPQNVTIQAGYDAAVEDRLLAESGWEHDGYRLFSIACLALSSRPGWFLPIPESNCVTVSRQTFEQLGGFDIRFESPGGGLANHDYLARALQLTASRVVVLLGEGTFHQVHGGVATNVPLERHPMSIFAAEYERLRGGPFSDPPMTPVFLGGMPTAALPFLYASAQMALGDTGNTVDASPAPVWGGGAVPEKPGIGPGDAP